MKFCTKCLSYFPNDLRFCTNDGSPLLSHPEFGEEATVVRRQAPVNVHVAASSHQPPVRAGWLVGGGLVFPLSAALMVALGSVGLLGKTANVTNRQKTPNGPKTVSDTAKKSETPAVEPASPRPEKKDTVVIDTKPASNKKANGRVVMLNAIVRAAPTMEAEEVEIVSLNEELIVGGRATPNSPWYRVTTASGTRGWIHGNMFEFAT